MAGKKARLAVTVGGALILAGFGSAAFADPIDPVGPDGTGVVLLELEAEGEGGLWMSVADDQETLVEDTAQAVGGVRVFEGTLPTVTVSDTRTGSEVPEPGDVYWYVTGEVADFVHDDLTTTIPGHQLGWAPAMTTNPGGDVDPGDLVCSSVDDTDGASTNECVGGTEGGIQGGSDLLFWALDSGDANPFKAWSAQAALTLKTSGVVLPGHYAADLTLTLMEDPTPVWP
jgi:hypothetical protein